ncbi:MAG TPA: type VI secretion system protein TssA [Acetobacteraceae bacterium]|nr:type VI secretion system protein TssA [Acetobacteraceae bacterium]
MPLLADLDLDSLLAPFGGDTPAGVDPREDFSPLAPYRAMRTARGAARAAERAADADPTAEQTPPPEWRTVRQLALKLLGETCKDLEVAAWLAEALVRTEGLSGLTASAQIIGGLTRQFWDQGLLPPLDSDGVAGKVSPVEGLSGTGGDGTLMQPLRKTVLFNKPDGSPVAFWAFDASMKLQGEADQNRIKQRIAAGVTLFEEMERDARAAGGAHFAALRKEARAGLQAWNDMSAALDEKAGSDSPSTSRVRALLQEILDVANRYAPPEIAEVAPVADTEEAAEPGAPGAVAAPKPPRENREDMLRDLSRIADFFRRTEPHSPLAYTLDEAVRRGRMTLPDLLEELVPDAGTRGNILTQLGIKVPKG